MQRVNAAQLPPPPAGKAGWPWMVEGTIAPPQGGPGDWPRITVVTPSFNQGAYLEETIRSVLLQGYPNLEYMVIDGGSSDESPAIVERYAPCLSYWVVEKDRGQSDAIAKGFARATGELINWLNSDDLLLPGALAALGAAARANPGAAIAGEVIRFGAGVKGEPRLRQRGLTHENLVKYWTGAAYYQQPALYYPRAAYEAAGGLDIGLWNSMDYDLFCRVLRHAPVVYLPQPLVRFRYHEASKTVTSGDFFMRERLRASQRYWPGLVSAAEAREARRYTARFYARRAVRRLARGQLGRARELFGEAWRLAPEAALSEPWAMSFGYVRRRLPGAGAGV
ncbi:MAG TPA: glycosyltransferase family 2 protein [Chloroflexaceae bacterium]|nr:glycosyltransferase family 2 protein [Chloroflexaceae bacterium]